MHKLGSAVPCELYSLPYARARTIVYMMESQLCRYDDCTCLARSLLLCCLPTIVLRYYVLAQGSKVACDDDHEKLSESNNRSVRKNKRDELIK